LDKAGKEVLVSWAEELMDKYPEFYYGEEAKNLDSEDWTRESWKIAKDFAYPLTYKSNKITEEY